MKDINRLIEIGTPEKISTPIESEGLDQVVEIIEFYNISDEDLRNFFHYRERINNLSDRLEEELLEEFIKDRLQYAQKLAEELDEEILSLSALFHLLPGNTIDTERAKSIKSLDVPEGLIQKFLDDRLERLERYI